MFQSKIVITTEFPGIRLAFSFEMYLRFKEKSRAFSLNNITENFPSGRRNATFEIQWFSSEDFILMEPAGKSFEAIPMVL